MKVYRVVVPYRENMTGSYHTKTLILAAEHEDDLMDQLLKITAKIRDEGKWVGKVSFIKFPETDNGYRIYVKKV